MKSRPIYGVVDSNGCHVDVSLSERGAKNYATRHGYKTVSRRMEYSYHAFVVAEKQDKRWVKASSQYTYGI